jgi:PTH1 family peptidyl-tRNA hydrolase
MDDTYLIVGLGNPGREYAETRHNIGFRILNRLAEDLGVRFSRQQHDAFLASGLREGRKVLLAKPQTYMNLSGRSVAGLLRFYRVGPDHLLVCCDDIDLPFGALRIRASGGSAGQRGMQSILEALGSKDIPRLRFGVGRLCSAEIFQGRKRVTFPDCRISRESRFAVYP